MPSRTDSPLQIAIIGAGLGGLGAAVALRRQGQLSRFMKDTICR